ncbi:MAG TPA: hypothetical protein PK986_11975 [Spirochaetota bacterium]|nr:hypothetical protein [Spirochaetota bacterium]
MIELRIFPACTSSERLEIKGYMIIRFFHTLARRMGMEPVLRKKSIFRKQY